jgi:hypothetical protein
MPTIHVTDAQIYRADPAAPTKRWTGNPVAQAPQVAVHDSQPKVAQPFRFANGSTINDFVVGGAYWLLGVADDGRRVWRLRLLEVRQAGLDVMLSCHVD